MYPVLSHPLLLSIQLLRYSNTFVITHNEKHQHNPSIINNNCNKNNNHREKFIKQLNVTIYSWKYLNIVAVFFFVSIFFCTTYWNNFFRILIRSVDRPARLNGLAWKKGDRTFLDYEYYCECVYEHLLPLFIGRWWWCLAIILFPLLA